MTYIFTSLIFLGAGYVVSEWIYRIISIRNSRSHYYVNNLILYSSSIHSEPHKEILFRYCGIGGEILWSADIKLNNMGLFSTHDYHPEKDADCYRILVLGQEQTASSVVDHSWPDFLEEILNEGDKSNFEGKYVKVYNLAWPDNGFAHMEETWKAKGALYSADLVLININDTDVYRDMAGTPQTIKGKPLVHSLVEYRAGSGEDDVATISLSGSDKVTSLADPRAVPPHPYGFFASRSFMRSPEKIKIIQEQVASDFLKGCRMGLRLWLARLLLGRSFDVTVVRNFDAMPSKPADKKALARKACGHLLSIIEDHSNTLIIANAHWGELNTPGPYEFSTLIHQTEPRIDIIDMRENLSAFRQDEDGYDWYLNPFMKEKWSLKGHMVYAQAVAEVIRMKTEAFAK